jgi:hypothetical protein
LWLSAAGFEKAAFFPCETFPAPIVRAKGETIDVLVSTDGTLVSREMMWWGP